MGTWGVGDSIRCGRFDLSAWRLLQNHTRTTSLLILGSCEPRILAISVISSLLGLGVFSKKWFKASNCSGVNEVRFLRFLPSSKETHWLKEEMDSSSLVLMHLVFWSDKLSKCEKTLLSLIASARLVSEWSVSLLFGYFSSDTLTQFSSTGLILTALFGVISSFSNLKKD